CIRRGIHSFRPRRVVQAPVQTGRVIVDGFTVGVRRPRLHRASATAIDVVRNDLARGQSGRIDRDIVDSAVEVVASWLGGPPVEVVAPYAPVPDIVLRGRGRRVTRDSLGIHIQVHAAGAELSNDVVP